MKKVQPRRGTRLHPVLTKEVWHQTSRRKGIRISMLGTLLLAHEGRGVFRTRMPYQRLIADFMYRAMDERLYRSIVATVNRYAYWVKVSDADAFQEGTPPSAA